MKKSLLAIIFLPFLMFGQEIPKLTDEMAVRLSEKPLHCVNQEYPNKTAHIINNEKEVTLSPKDLHPSFYGCFDWHSSVHGHWMLLRLLKTKPGLSVAKDIENILDNSFKKENLQTEADYFTKYQLTGTFERTYGWAWLLKLDEELATWNHPKAKIWHENLKPLTDKILASWKTFLPKQTYPNRTGVHPNTAFAMVFALDWARATGDKDFENQLIEKAKYFYLNNTKTPAYLEPDGSDFFSPSLEIADLMRRVLPQKEFVVWLNNFYEKRSLENIEKIPVVSDLSDYQTVHLVGLSFSKAWCMKGIAKSLPVNHSLKQKFEKTANVFLNNGLPLLFQGNYGGDHWLASFAVYALED
ncbi:DUF2891 domain-containing protein [Chryseobacterium gambrini]|uniref:DUF2891 domain-containing protein n=1 Tax=Chryseobacterium gambrini TaxID=373672 RepID=A0AAJ1R7I8_9FLAO|nr:MULTISPECIES: DUF2891 domain-containing protein [Chryseobacterium]MDN4012968.1 DUF2891 domain-containing protein [Chryseobacterium gambrini]MDN4030755.1 DUF2891 domain-containing protein [Chryseobacterium gambrini]QWA38639.1 DUF2891 family protein [Chryseobacterium sp. ZHDP1]